MVQQQENAMVKAASSNGENMPDIQSLSSRVQCLTESVDRWNMVMIWALIFAAVAAIGVVVATRIVVTQGKKLADAQSDLIDAKDTQLALDLKGKDKEIAEAVKNAAEANERATKAQASLSLAEQHATEANAKAEGFRLEIAKAKESSAKAEARAAEANLKLAEFKLPRTIKPQQHTAIVACLRNRPKGAVFMRPAALDQEAVTYAKQIGAILEEAGFEIKTWPQGAVSWSIPGAFMIVKNLQTAPIHAVSIQECFNASGIFLVGYNGDDLAADQVSIAVGAR